MKSEDILKLRKEFHDFALKEQNAFFAEPNNLKLKHRYITIGEIYKKLLTKNNENDIRAYLSEILKTSKELEGTYRDLYTKYKSNQISVSAKSLNELAYKINAYVESIKLINKHLPKQKAVEVSPTNIDKKTSDESIALSDEIIALLDKQNNLDINSKEAKDISKKVFDLIEGRKDRYIKLLGPTCIKELNELESLEIRISKSNNRKMLPLELNKSNYAAYLMNCINAVNEYCFVDYLDVKDYFKNDNNISDEKNKERFGLKFQAYYRRFNCIIHSIFNCTPIEFEVDGEMINSDDLLSYLSIYNLKGGFDVFKSKNNKLNIGNNNINKKDYDESVEYINKCIKALLDLCKKNVKDKIVVSDITPSRDDLIELRNKKLTQINNMVIRRKAEIRGGVHAR